MKILEWDKMALQCHTKFGVANHFVGIERLSGCKLLDHQMSGQVDLQPQSGGECVNVTCCHDGLQSRLHE